MADIVYGKGEIIVLITIKPNYDNLALTVTSGGAGCSLTVTPAAADRCPFDRCVVHYAEIGTKSGNRRMFEDALARNVARAARPWVRVDVRRETGRLTFPLAGVAPVDAVVIQLLVMFLVLGATAVCVATVVAVCARSFVTDDLRLSDWVRDQSG